MGFFFFVFFFIIGDCSLKLFLDLALLSYE